MQIENSDLNTIEQFFQKFPQYTEEERQDIKKAWDWLTEKTSSKIRPCGEPYTNHPLRTAAILANIKMDSESVIGALLHSSTELEGVTLDDVEALFGSSVRTLVDGSSRITGLKIQNKTLHQADSVRKMLFAMVDDIRVILVKLADRLDRMRNLKNVESEKQKAISQEVLDIWAPLANRLGMSSVKDELEDLSLKYTNPDAYEQIKHLVMLKKGERSVYLEKAQKEIYKAAEKAGIKVTISSRAKHFYSIYQKMKKKGKAPDEIYDLLALRVICNDNAECYTLVGLVHNLWKPLDGRFKDYIAMPKPNGYQSLHTTVLCDGMPLEIQIRTVEMHSVAEHGVASHWLYKKGTNRDAVSLENLSIINQLKELRAEHGNDAELFAEIREELLGDSIFVFTPKGDIRELPAGATAIDFAYSIHSHIGETIVGAKADGHIIPLSSPLKNTEIIEILTNPQAHPTVNQLTVVKTARARSKIRAWLLQNEPELKLDTAVAAAGIGQSSGQGVTGQQNRLSGQQAHASDLRTYGGEGKALSDGRTEGGAGGAEERSSEPIHIRIGDTTNFLVKAAGCCNPVYGDEIVGYVSRGRGLIIHKKGCRSYSLIPNVSERTVSVVWEEKPVTISDKVKKK
ncbi:MAG: RelA/SpoT family protein [Treponemataceae bacterium]|nr:RelA/SpoT family protein [Treponemataceae bacterium]